jgi:chemotaxis protein methyltransferase CheR
MMTNDQAIEEIARIAKEATGVQLSLKHRSMIQSRLQRRMTELGLADMPGYLRHLKSHFGTEKAILVAALTTHHTYFFREFAHFEYLRDTGLREIVAALRAEKRNILKIWCAACSRGQESYSLAMWILPWLADHAPDIKLKIYGTDVDAESVKIAENGVYQKSELAEVPLSLLSTHWAKGSGEIAAFVKAKASLRACVEFKTENLFQLRPATESYDVIFCRNVFIYFNPEQIKTIAQEMEKRLAPHGLFFVGISETLSGMGMNLDSPGPSVYRKKGRAPSAAAAAPALSSSAPLIRVLCVDDSPTILAILKKILTKDMGFEVVATAINGIEAAKAIKSGGIDLVTLDIHMPEMDGIQYMRQHFGPSHPPVVMLSSVSRENSDLAFQALELGAADYVEKPSLADLHERADEIRFKLKCARGSSRRAPIFDRQFERKFVLAQPEECLRIVFCDVANWKRSAEFLKGIAPRDPSTLVWIEGAGALNESLMQKFASVIGKPLPSGPGSLKPGELACAGESWPSLVSALRGKRVSVQVIGKLSPAGEKKLGDLRDAQILLEDLGDGATLPFRGRGNVWLLPLTSFLYQSHEFFSTGRKAA